MDQVLERISIWEAAGLIDPETAARLRLAEADRPQEDPASDTSSAADDQPGAGRDGTSEPA
jgi:hypothetical protein